MAQEFEFYREIEKWQKEKKQQEMDLNAIKMANEGKRTVRVAPQEKQTHQKKKTRRTFKIKRNAAIFLLAITFAAGIGTKTVYDKVAPVVSTYLEYESTRSSMAGWEENFLMSKDGYMLEMDIKTIPHDSIFADGPEPYDYENPDNLTVMEDGRKVGALVDYYDGFDRYLEEETGKGYYEEMYEQMTNFKELGLEMPSETIYTYEELSKMFGENKGLGE